MHRRNIGAATRRLGQVLAGAEFPAAKWQLVMHAEHYGADADTRSELWSLPPGTYGDLGDVLVALGLALPGPRRRPRYRAQPAPQAAGRIRPAP